MLKSDHPFISFTYWACRSFIGPIIRLLFIKKVTGLANIPSKGPAILAFNHQSFFDFISFAAIAPRNVHFLAAEKFFERWPWFFLMSITGQIKVNRRSTDKSTMHNDIKNHISKGKLIGIFPEGTRSPHEMEMLKAFTGVAKFCLKYHVPVVPIGISGTYSIMSKHDKLFRLKKIVRIDVGHPLYFHEYHDLHENEVICRQITENVMREIEKLSGKKYSHYE
jgi:1-acyl-sn-glycerol-3-phosphate acyltransferase